VILSIIVPPAFRVPRPIAALLLIPLRLELPLLALRLPTLILLLPMKQQRQLSNAEGHLLDQAHATHAQAKTASTTAHLSLLFLHLLVLCVESAPLDVILLNAQRLLELLVLLLPLGCQVVRLTAGYRGEP
jgi:hypothetical protein